MIPRWSAMVYGNGSVSGVYESPSLGQPVSVSFANGWNQPEDEYGAWRSSLADDRTSRNSFSNACSSSTIEEFVSRPGDVHFPCVSGVFDEET